MREGEKQMAEKPYCVFTLRMANNLVEQGYELLGTSIDIKNPKYKVFLFKDSAELREAVKKLSRKRK